MKDKTKLTSQKVKKYEKEDSKKKRKIQGGNKLAKQEEWKEENKSDDNF